MLFRPVHYLVKNASRPSVTNAKVVETFRGEMRAAIPMHPQELALVVIASAHLCFLPWALGARAPWAQLVSLIFGLTAFVVGLWPRRYKGELAPQGAFILHPWSRLLRFPIFWLGLLLFAYVTCQGLNPAYVRAAAGPYWWLAPIKHVEWLPSGVDAPFSQMNAWRMLVIWTGAWALVCALWAGLTRRVAAHSILTVVIANGALLALIGILQKVTYAKQVLWLIKPVAPTFLATFFYENHGGAYFNLIAVMAVAVMVSHHMRSLRRFERSSPALVYAFALIVVAAVVFMSGSRASAILLATYLLTCAVTYGAWRLRIREGTTHPAVACIIATGAAALIGAAAWFLNLDRTITQIKDLTKEQERSAAIHPRALARQATLDLFDAVPSTGWGAGSFRHIFPLTQRKYPEIYRGINNTTYSWAHAHNDYAQILAELGLVGTAFPALMLLWGFAKFCRIGGLTQPAYLLGFFGLCMPLAHAWFDFPFYSCAVLTTFCALFTLLSRSVELETSR